jgi:hypothetical protein
MLLGTCARCGKAVAGGCLCLAVVVAAMPENGVAVTTSQPMLVQPFTPPDHDNREDEPTGPQPNRIITVAASTTVSAGIFEVVKFTTPGWPPGSSDAD